tara:strand:+ start:929 stop:1669 length:741 start_codon:yes stop_codon:yes gene_type:complete
MNLTKIIIGNWKMNGSSSDGLNQVKKIAENVTNAKVCHKIVICPPFTLLREMEPILSHAGISIGGQDCHFSTNGPYTGDISAEMLVDQGCKFVILGHSERRVAYSENDQKVRMKANEAIRSGLNVIVCVGEDQFHRNSGKALDFVSSQIDASLPDVFSDHQLIIAYEPVWAIGFGRTPSLIEIQEMHEMIESKVKSANIKKIYGGSVTKDNAREIMSNPAVDGVLVGGASLKCKSFWPIIEAANEI